jgi:VIT1/CCC1 family predicted Fe2+/Mn2+ transporter
VNRIGSSKLVIAGGLAELVAGAISMGLGEYLSSDVRAKQWVVEEERERREVREMPDAEEEEIYDIFAEYGVTRAGASGVVEQLKSNEDQWVAVSILLFVLGCDV